MPVDGYLELFTTMFGWTMYSVVWDVLNESGITLIPFIAIIVSGWSEAYKGGRFGSAAGLSLAQIELDIFIAFFVVFIAGVPSPLTPVNAAVLEYTPPPSLDTATPVTAKISNSQSTFGVTGFTGNETTVNVPLWWYGVFALSSGINHAIVTGLPGSIDLRSISQQAKLATVKDPLIREEVTQFYSECFIPAQARYYRSKNKSAAIDALLTDYGNNDPDWIGSHVYRNVAGYYDSIRPRVQITGWPFNINQVPSYQPPYPEWGHPTCKEWWESGTFSITGGVNSGLQMKLVEESAPELLDIISKAASWLQTNFGFGAVTADKIRDWTAKSVLVKEPIVYSPQEFMRQRGEGFESYVLKGKIFADWEIGKLWVVFNVAMPAITSALPMIQAIVLLAVYALLPFIVIASRYSLSMLITGALIIFTLKFMTSLWFIAQWVDTNLMTSMYPETSTLVATAISITGGAGQEHISKRMVLDVITGTLYLGLPVIWVGLMGAVGMHAARFADDMQGNFTSPVKQSANAGGQATMGAGKGIAKGIGKGLTKGRK